MQASAPLRINAVNGLDIFLFHYNVQEKLLQATAPRDRSAANRMLDLASVRALTTALQGMRGDVRESRADAGAPRGGGTLRDGKAAIMGAVRDLASWPAFADRFGSRAHFAWRVPGPAPTTLVIGRDRHPPAFGSRALTAACVQRKDDPGTANRRKCRKGSANAGLGRDLLFVACPDPNLGSPGLVRFSTNCGDLPLRRPLAHVEMTICAARNGDVELNVVRIGGHSVEAHPILATAVALVGVSGRSCHQRTASQDAGKRSATDKRCQWSGHLSLPLQCSGEIASSDRGPRSVSCKPNA